MLIRTVRNALVFVLVGASLLSTALFGQQPESGVKILSEEIVGPTAGSRMETRRIVLGESNKLQTFEFVSGVNVGPTDTKSPYSEIGRAHV